MPFPESERVKFTRNPIAEVICQLRFPPILSISVQPPAQLQEMLRGEYPLFEIEEAPGVPKEVAEILSRIGGASRLSEGAVNKFLVDTRTRLVSLSQDFVALAEHKYEDWATFSRSFVRVKDSFESVYRPSFYSRLGLRYVNRISRKKLGLSGTPWHELIEPAFTGISGVNAVAEQVQSLQTTAVINLGRSLKGSKVTVRTGIRKSANGEPEFVIDSDFYSEGRTEAGDVIERLNQFNRLNGHLFRWAVRRDGPLWTALGPVAQ